jgi:hypothetical protein
MRFRFRTQESYRTLGDDVVDVWFDEESMEHVLSLNGGSAVLRLPFDTPMTLRVLRQSVVRLTEHRKLMAELFGPYSHYGGLMDADD